MKLFDGGRAPNPRRVRIYLHEKGLVVPLEPVDMASVGQSEEIARRNPLKRLPVLELDDGTILTESVAICRYFEALHPEPPMFGEGALGQALVEMWNRRVELLLYGAVAAVFRHLHPGMKEREVPQVAEWGEVNKRKAREFVEFLDRELESRPFIAGDRFSIADITAMIAVDFMKPAKLEVPDNCSHLRRWHDEVSARPSAAA